MKKLGITLVAAAGMFMFTQNVQAQVEEPEEIEQIETVEEAQEKKDDYKAVDVLALPQAVKDAVMTDMNGAVAEEAWVKEKDGKSVYKLALNTDGVKTKAYIDQEGNWIEKKDK
ncbi:hypothetical protein LB467_07860 [Salegentibacter sp. JZCK2]|uniref:hypothetical protein n=1 Tax=Salegentibacter tibetensis TaxID=2873600 RepID=UPI001CCCBCF3|nr:hypothetical protein [Salegentibacter tibetensis]MBZ9729603.1 hypothetical protein [Salegentibacter tibetensis]